MASRTQLNGRIALSVVAALTAAVVWGGAAPSPAGEAVEPKKPLSLPEGARIRLVPLKDRWFLGENILLYYEVTNAGDQPFHVDSGGDYRGGTRAYRYKVDAVSELKAPQDDPTPDQLMFGGLGGSFETASGKTWSGHVPLMRYRNLEHSGTYTIRVAHDLGWGPLDPESRHDPRWVEATISTVMPNEEQARAVVTEMMQTKDVGYSRGEKRPPYPDFTCLRYPVYVPVLLELAKDHHPAAIEGLAGVPTPAGTAALIELLHLPDDRRRREQAIADRKQRGQYAREGETIADAAARALSERLPYSERLRAETAHFWRTDAYYKIRDKLVAASWRPEHAEPVRKYAKEILLHSRPRGLRDDRKENAVELLQCIGVAEDHPAIVAALDNAFALSQQLPLESPLDYGVIPRLQTCAKALNIAPAPEPQTPGEIAVYLWTLDLSQPARPADFSTRAKTWLQHPLPFIRRLTLEALPRPIPAWAIEELTPLLKSEDVGVRLQAAKAATDAADSQLRPTVMQQLALEQDRWVMDALNEAAYATGAPRDQILEVWARRLGESMYDPASQEWGTGAKSFTILQSNVFDYNGGSGWNGGQRRGDKGLSERWLAFIDKNREEILRGRKFRVGDPELTADLFPHGAHIHHEGKPWPPQRPRITEFDDVVDEPPHE